MGVLLMVSSLLLVRAGLIGFVFSLLPLTIYIIGISTINRDGNCFWGFVSDVVNKVGSEA